MYPSEQEQIKEYYRCHFSANEVSKFTKYGYGTIIDLYRTWKNEKVKKYDRMKLSEGVKHDAIVNQELLECST